MAPVIDRLVTTLCRIKCLRIHRNVVIVDITCHTPLTIHCKSEFASKISVVSQEWHYVRGHQARRRDPFCTHFRVKPNVTVYDKVTIQKQESVNSVWWWDEKMWSFHSIPFPPSQSHSHFHSMGPMGIPNIDLPLLCRITTDARTLSHMTFVSHSVTQLYH